MPRRRRIRGGSAREEPPLPPRTELDVAIVGAGFAGIYMLHRARGLGLRARAYEAGSGVGGTWFWNRYPGARCDIESFEYSYQFSEELQQEWEWSERFASQAEILRSPRFLAELAAHGWPGNVRELRNYLERCLALELPPPLEARQVGIEAPRVDATIPIKVARERWLLSFERAYLEDALARHQGNVSAAARAAGIERVTMYRLLWKHGLR